ncbi:MAG TPA: ABC transporter ATP-binding protein [Thermomicrobiales bacterium]|nr:ABC transporter ATP-binding protein [Thermomicrobiales bacterium]
MSRVTLQRVVKSFGPVQAVREVSCEMPDRAFVTLLGPSGCGKTTTLNLIAGLEKATSGEILLDDERITDWAPHERGMAMVFQNYALYPHMNVYGNMAFSLKLGRRPKAEIDSRVRRVAQALEIDHLLDRRVAQLSGGQQQRVALARAMVKEPKVFLFDEPLSNLDAALRTRMRSEIKRLHQLLRATSIFVTHDQEEAMMLSDYIAVMRDGQIVQYGPAEEVYRRPRHLYVATFIGKPRMSTVEGDLRVTADAVTYQAGDLRLAWPNAVAGRAAPPRAARAVLGIRAEDVRLDAPNGDLHPNQLRGEVGLLEPLGSDTFVEVNRGPVTITGRVEPDRRLRVEDRVVLTLPRHKLHFFDAETGERLDV